MTSVRLPTSKLVLLLLALCRQQPEARFEKRDGWLYYRWTGIRGGQGMVGVPADNPNLVDALRRTTTETRSFVELAAILVCLATLGGVSGAWCLERVAELLYGKRLPKSHRERQLPPLKGWLALLEHGYWQLDTGEGGGGRRGTKRPTPAIRITGSLLTVVQHTRCSATATASPSLAEDLRSAFSVVVPAALLLLPNRDHHNPWGNTPGLAARARIRLAGAIAGRWRSSTSQPVRAEELLGQWAALDLAPVRKRRRLRAWVRAAESELAGTASTGGPGLQTSPAWERQPLRTLFHLVVGSAGPGGVRQGRARAPT